MTGVSVAPRRVGIRSDIQALRAIAVMAVVVGHFFPVRLSGGFVGVDVFFVVSGFLITAHLLREIERTGRLRLSEFYVRRARRLLPAAYTVLVVSLAGALLLLPVSRWRDTAAEVFASAAYFQNWLLAVKAADFSAAGASATVVRHYWSLSVEEQFYLCWPLLLIAGFALAAKVARRPRAVLAVMLLVVGGLSFWSAMQLTAQDLTTAYFVTYTRVWEFAVGALLAVAAPLLTRMLGERGVLRGAMQWLGLAMIFAAVFAFTTETEFPGPWAALPVLGTALVIAAGPELPRFTPMRLATVRPVQLTGDISYSLYLWHWPLLVLAPFVLGRSLGAGERLLLLAFAFGLSWLTKRYIEDPGRERLLSAVPPPRVFGALGASVAVFGLLALPVAQLGQLRVEEDRTALAERARSDCFGAGALREDADCGDPFAATDLLVVGESESPWYEHERCEQYGTGAPLMRCDFSDGAPDAQGVWLVGDAAVKNWKPAALALAEQHGWVLSMSPKGGCSATSGHGEPAGFDLAKWLRCQQWSSQINSRIEQERPDLVLASQSSSRNQKMIGSDEPSQQRYAEGVTQLAEEWSRSGAQIAVLRDIPETLSLSTSECLELHMTLPLECASPRAEALLADPFVEAFQALERENVAVLDLTDAFCDEDRCYALVGGLPVHFDDRHMSRSYSETLAPRLWDQLEPLLER